MYDLRVRPVHPRPCNRTASHLRHARHDLLRQHPRRSREPQLRGRAPRRPRRGRRAVRARSWPAFSGLTNSAPFAALRLPERSRPRARRPSPPAASTAAELSRACAATPTPASTIPATAPLTPSRGRTSGCSSCSTGRRSPSRTSRCSSWRAMFDRRARRAAASASPSSAPPRATPGPRPCAPSPASGNVRIAMLHPEGRVSPVQRRQMTTEPGGNVLNIAVQRHVRRLPGPGEGDVRRRAVPATSSALSAVNSINWARVVAQAVYYVYAALRLGAPERPVAFCVPTGNFGNVYAGWVARRLGLPVARLIVATNEQRHPRPLLDRRRLRARPGRRHHQPVNGHPGGEQLRAPAPRSRGRRCRPGACAAWTASASPARSPPTPPPSAPSPPPSPAAAPTSRTHARHHPRHAARDRRAGRPPHRCRPRRGRPPPPARRHAARHPRHRPPGQVPGRGPRGLRRHAEAARPPTPT